MYEGPDGSGKTTQYRHAVELLKRKGFEVLEVREPGGTSVGEKVRDVLLDHVHKDMTVATEFLLYMASRAQLVGEKIIPALKRNEIVIADRFYMSTQAYQLVAGQLSERVKPDFFKEMCEIACPETHPGKVFIFDVDPETAAKRLNPLLDRMEAKGRAFHEKVRKGYLDMAKENEGVYEIIDASRDLETVKVDALSRLEKHLGINLTS